MKHRIKQFVVIFAGIFLLVATYVVAGRIAPLLPAEGASTCFEGSYNGSIGLTFGFPHERLTEEAHVVRFNLRLDRKAGQAPKSDLSTYHYDRRYDFWLAVKTADKGRFKSSGQCDWTDSAFAKFSPGLYCFIDCDGGGIELNRVPVVGALDMIWEADGWLRMSACGGGGEILRAGAKSKTFRLEAVPDEACKDLPLASY